MIARLTRYHAPPSELGALMAEVVERARANRDWPVTHIDRRAEFFLTDSATGDCLSIVFGDDPNVASAVEPARPSSGEPRTYVVRCLALGGPRGSGVVDALFGRVVHRMTGAADVERKGPLPSPEVWARALLVSPDDDEAVGVAVASDASSLDQALLELAGGSMRVEDYDDVAYHFLSYGGLRSVGGRTIPAG